MGTEPKAFDNLFVGLDFVLKNVDDSLNAPFMLVIDCVLENVDDSFVEPSSSLVRWPAPAALMFGVFSDKEIGKS